MPSEPGRKIEIESTGTVHVTEGFEVARRHYLTSNHLQSALLSAKDCREYELRHRGAGVYQVHQSHAMTCVMSCVAFLESLVNELYQDAAESAQGRITGIGEGCRQMLAEFWEQQSRAGLILKFQMALLFAGAERFNMGVQPGQDLKLLIDWRNALIHYKPEWRSPEKPTSLEKQLTNRFPRSKPIPENSPDPWPSWALGIGGCDWAIQVAKDCADEWTTRVGIEQYYKAEIWNGVTRTTQAPPL